MTNRIAMDFAILLLVTGLFLVCAFLGIRMRSLAEVPKETAEELAYAMENGTVEREELKAACVFLQVISEETEEIVYRVGERPGRWSLGKWCFVKEDGALQRSGAMRA